MLRATAVTAGFDSQNILTIPNELEATRHALSLGQPGDLVVVFADAITPVWKEVIYFGKSVVAQEQEL